MIVIRLFLLLLVLLIAGAVFLSGLLWRMKR